MSRVLICISTAILAFASHLNAAVYTTDMSWPASGPVVLAPSSGSGPLITVTFASSRGFGLVGAATHVGYHYGGSHPILTFTFSHNVADVELGVGDLDASVEDLDTMSPVPAGATGDLYLSGATVKSSKPNGNGTILYDTVAAGQPLTFRFDDQLSNLSMPTLSFYAVPEPASLVLLTGASLALLAKPRRTHRAA